MARIACPHRCQRLRTRKLRQMSGLTALYLPLLTRIACRRLRLMKLRQVYDLAVAVYLLNILLIARMACPHRCRHLHTRKLRQMSGLTAPYLPLLNRIACRRLRTMQLRQVSDLMDVYSVLTGHSLHCSDGLSASLPASPHQEFAQIICSDDAAANLLFQQPWMLQALHEVQQMLYIFKSKAMDEFNFWKFCLRVFITGRRLPPPSSTCSEENGGSFRQTL
jgi:hypothetical protein